MFFFAPQTPGLGQRIGLQEPQSKWNPLPTSGATTSSDGPPAHEALKFNHKWFDMNPHVKKMPTGSPIKKTKKKRAGGETKQKQQPPGLHGTQRNSAKRRLSVAFGSQPECGSEPRGRTLPSCRDRNRGQGGPYAVFDLAGWFLKGALCVFFVLGIRGGIV